HHPAPPGILWQWGLPESATAVLATLDVEFGRDAGRRGSGRSPRRRDARRGLAPVLEATDDLHAALPHARHDLRRPGEAAETRLLERVGQPLERVRIKLVHVSRHRPRAVVTDDVRSPGPCHGGTSPVACRKINLASAQVRAVSAGSKGRLAPPARRPGRAALCILIAVLL